MLFLLDSTVTSATSGVLANFMAMSVAAFISIIVYILKTLKTDVATTVWLKTNWVRFVLGVCLLWLLSALISLVPDATVVLSQIGFAVDKTPAALGLVVGLLIIGATSEPSKSPEGAQ